MKKVFLSWEDTPVVLFTEGDEGVPRAAFMKNDLYNAWRAVNPLQVWVEAEELARSHWRKKFKSLGVETLPKFKDWDSKDVYQEDDPWYEPDDDLSIDKVKKLETKEQQEAATKRFLRRIDWHEDEIEIEN